MRLAVRVLDACDLLPKDGQGSASAYAEVDFDGQRQRTRTLAKDLNPAWNETLVFDVADPSGLPDRTIEVALFNDAGASPRKFLGRVRLSGSAVAPSLAEASPFRCPLDKRGLFSNIRGDLALLVYALPDAPQPVPVPPSPFPSPVEKNNPPEEEKKKKKKSNDPPPPPPPAAEDSKKKVAEKPKKEVRQLYSVAAEARADYARGGMPTAAAVAQMRAAAAAAAPRALPAAAAEMGGLVETRPSVAARLGFRGADRIASTFDLVEQMHYLYVSVVKARGLAGKEGGAVADSYVEVKLGNYRGLTRVVEKSSSPVWSQVFAFSKERLQSNVLEVAVKDKDQLKDDCLGRVLFDVAEVPRRVPPESPLAPEWYSLHSRQGERLDRGELMLAVWVGTQADESFPTAWHSDAHAVNAEGLVGTRSKVYFSPRLCYLRVTVLEAQDLVPADRTRPPDPYLRLQLGGQVRVTRPAAARSASPAWNEEHIFVAAEPFDEPLLVTVADRLGPGKEEVIGRLLVPVEAAHKRVDGKPVEPRWFGLARPAEDKDGPSGKFSSKLLLRLCLDMGYHVLDESTHYSSDFRAYHRSLWGASVGVLELGVLGARNLVPMKGRTTDAYCVAKYGAKWVRTRTLLDTMAPRWNEQYTWEIHDPCTVLTVGVFDNSHVNKPKDGPPALDQRIGKVRIRLSTLEANRVYTHYHPLLVLQPTGLKKTGELHLAIRFTCTAWVNTVALYARPLLPKMHYQQPIPVAQLDHLRRQAMEIVASRLARAEPPLRREAVQYMLDVDSHMFSLRRSKANFYRVVALLSWLAAARRWLGGVCSWKNPLTTALVHALFGILVFFPELIPSTVFLYLFIIGVWNYTRRRPRTPPHMDTALSCAEGVHPDELDEEFDSFPSTRPDDIVRLRYDRLRSVAGRVQTVVGDLATQGERALAILSWRDPRATAICIMLSLVMALVLYVTPFQVLVFLAGVYLLRHPRFRSKMPSVPFNFYRRLPPKSDMLF
ncbi:FT-interacting protein 7-like [Wolffia australiana]